MTSLQDAFYLKIYLLLGFLTNGKTNNTNDWGEAGATKVRFEFVYSGLSFLIIHRESFQSRQKAAPSSIFTKVEAYFF